MVILVVLKICEDNFLFYITHTKYFNVLCYFVIIFLIFLFILVQDERFVNKFKNSKFKRFFVVGSFGLFVGFLIFLFAWLLNVEAFEGCATKYYLDADLKAKGSINKTLNKLDDTKIIVVGDSRMALIEDDAEIKKPFNFEFVAKSAMKINWFKTTALRRVKRILNNDDFRYHVVVNMGVNDLNSDDDVDELADDYFELYSKLAEDYPDIYVYIMSINPIDEKLRNETEPSNKRTTRKIKQFNDRIQENLDKSDLKNMYYCDAYNALDFKTIDGLHYTQNTNRKIIDYIKDECIDF